jgi:hypothetical protein
MQTFTSSAEMRSSNEHQFSGGLTGGVPGAWPTARSFGKAKHDTEFELRRNALVRSGARRPIERLASLLLAISRNNSYEGRDPNSIPDALTSGFVGDLLGVSVALLADLLVELASHGLVEASPAHGLRLVDIGGLEKLADAH